MRARKYARHVPELSESAWRRRGVLDTSLGSGWTSTRPQVGVPGLALGRPASESAGSPASPARLLERGVALVLLGIAAPVLAALLLFVLLADGRPVLYRGERLGLRRKPFRMLKVRTLRREAEKRTAERLLDARDHLEILGGRFLRDSRLDELPQLWNIVRGEMSFVGPRPERERVCRTLCTSIPGYGRRFEVRPGLLGPAQIFTPHATPKRIRAWLDNAWSRREHGTAELVGLTVFTALTTLRKAARWAYDAIRDDLLRLRVLQGHPERRRLRRVRPGAAHAFLLLGEGPGLHGRVLDLNEEAMLVTAPRAMPVGRTLDLVVAQEIAPGPTGARLRHARCTAVIRQCRAGRGGYRLVLEFLPSNDRSHYVLHQYLLRNALVCPREPGVTREREASLSFS
jgi:lipopolysaccharide/colanic/teichoic acid biosynthesis glycosyltransferase